jgi:hypothetical protein
MRDGARKLGPTLERRGLPMFTWAVKSRLAVPNIAEGDYSRPLT